MEHYALLNGAYTDKTLYDFKPVRAEGVYLYNEQNRKCLDLRSGLWNVSLGYDKILYQQVSKKISEVLNHGLPYLDIHSFKHDIYDVVADRILGLTGEAYQRVIYTNSGSENTEVALKIADYINKKSTTNRILTFKNSYHGTFFGGVSVSGIDQEINTSFFPKYGDVTFIDYPKNLNEEEQILTEISKIANDYDVMIIEPILASAGIYSASFDFFNKLLKVLSINNVISVFDEVATGFFKTGPSFYFKHLEDSPDILCLSKSINNGIIAFGCICIRVELDKKLQNSKRTKEHFSTQNGNLLGMISAETILNYYLEEQDSIEASVNIISQCIRNTFDRRGIEYRNVGIMTAVKTAPGHAVNLVKELERLGILVYLYCNEEEEGISIMPPLIMEKPLLEKSLLIIIKKISKHL